MVDPIRKLVLELSRLPGIGEKSANRLAYHLMRGAKQQVRDLAQALLDVTEKVRLCSVCMNMTDCDPCRICADARRDRHLICVVASPSETVAIDRGGHYQGTFHVLHGLLSPLEGIGPDDLRISELVRRMSADPAVQTEVVIATNPSVEGEATALYIARVLKPLGAKVTRIATGLSVGSEIEYADQATLSRAINHRTPL